MATIRMRPFIKLAAFFVLLLPAIVIVHAALNNSLGPDPAEALSHLSGTWSIRLLLLTLLISSLSRQVPFCKRWIILRKMCGLFVLAYSSFHLFVFVALYTGFDGQLLIEELSKRPYITAGFAAWLLLLPLAATSNNRMIKRLGVKRWRQIHRLVYLVLLVALAHIIWQVRSDWGEALLYCTCAALLFLERLLAHRRP